MKKIKSLIRHYKLFGFEFDNYDLKLFLTILIFSILIILCFIFKYG